MGKKMKIIQITWGILSTKALADAVSGLIHPLVSLPPATQILKFIDSWKISKILGLAGNTIYVDLFLAALGISLLFLARRLEEEEL